MIELALPAGSLETALTAFKSGADAVYFGLKDFSARKGAVNFSLEDLSKIRRYALENNKKIYLTINTLIDDKNISKMLSTLDAVSYYGNDGIIIQDLGVASLIRQYYPNLALHGSTQLAVHTTQGVKELQDLGFERVVLSRELTLQEIEKIRKDCPDIEIKAFIHGALCYGFSGLCSASFLKCGRSANGGECAQICRSWFVDEQSGDRGYFFSMEDMMAGEKLLELNRMGIDSAKVEGRLKSPEYVAAITRYYRSILDYGHATKEEEDAIATTFHRKSGTGYFDYKKNRPSLITGSYPGHMGLECGPVIRQNGSVITVETTERIESHDGLQYFLVDRYGLTQSEKFSANVIRVDRNSVVLKTDVRENLVGRTIYKISDSTKKEKTPSTNLPLYRKEVAISITLDSDSIGAEAMGKSLARTLVLQPAKNEVSPEEVIRKHFSESGDSRWTLGELTFINRSGIAYPFLPPSVMKDFRREFYKELDTLKLPSPTISEPKKKEGPTLVLPKRELLEKDLPWSFEPTVLEGRTYFTFPPVTFNEEKLFQDAEKAFKGEKVTIGLNNIAQVKFAKAHPEFDYFADVFLYLSNRYTLATLVEEVPNLIGGYLWWERTDYEGEWPFAPTVTDYELPAFISRTCYRHDALGLSCTGCKMHEDFVVSQAPDTFTVKVRNCLTVMKKN